MKLSDDEFDAAQAVLTHTDWPSDEDCQDLRAIVVDGATDIDTLMRASASLRRNADAVHDRAAEPAGDLDHALRRAIDALAPPTRWLRTETVVYLDNDLASAIGDRLCPILTHPDFPAEWADALRHVAEHGITRRTRPVAQTAQSALAALLYAPSEDIATSVPARAIFVAIQRALAIVELA